MLRILKITILLAFVTLVLPGCNKWLKLQPQDGIVKEEFWNTKEQVQSSVTGIYASLLGSSNSADRPLAEYLWLWGEGRADMVTPTPNASNEELELVNANILPTNSLTNWGAVYKTINYCNTVIQLAPGVLGKDPTFTQQQLDAALSEALAIRALMYFYLVRSFRDVPLKLTATLSDQDLTPLVKSDASQILTQIVKDLKAAEPNAVLSYGNRASDKGRITRYTVNAILADVYLWMNQYNECVTECDKLVNSGQFGLVQGSGAMFNSLYVDGNSNESIFEFQFDVQKVNSFYRMFLVTRRWQASSRVMDEFFTIDLNDPNNLDLRADGCSVRASDVTIWKYIGVSSTSARSADQSYAHWIVYRYADILLMKAEALSQLGKGSDALQLVDRIRRRSNALAATAQTPDTTNATAVSDYILSERSREFAFEGKRWYDILRNAKRQFTTDPDYLANLILPSVPPTRQQSVLSKYRDPNSLYFPIYFYELQTNKLLVQNPFYK